MFKNEIDKLKLVTMDYVNLLKHI